ncbi:hypothetical protein CEV08_07655 [Bartonella tribocorum]|uniref:Uncharacterized protein n=2 Tax=Bartonella tribocorum TaxID=85701 RepID=A0A2M6UR10_9HYPH|nr:hypothetical protein CEV08_07655 [Bartonella tribocorum]
MAIFFSQVLGVNAGSLNSKFQDTGLISVMTQENGVIKAADMVIRQFGAQGAEKNIQRVVGLIGMESALLGGVGFIIFAITMFFRKLVY